MYTLDLKLSSVFDAVSENLLKTVGGSRLPEEPLSLAVVWSVQRVDVVYTVCP